ncbi:hypothetical protein LTR36_005351 [Oleoguttula mirabilis]|uniref:Uncharacterized protein n=1 Tax=Oleoguttula mirabilis TaxID=1507867 RepID=A0AAV9JF14_9PEZI|nr:hypothetical protein LTR36_005351 [Oleoguttula mirabilis]
MSILRGAQSALFYYLSCAPCADAKYRKKRKAQAIRDRADKVLMEEEMGGQLYRQPSPAATNPHWDAEIALGPTMTRGKRKTNTADSQRGLKGSALQSSNASNITSSVSLPRNASGERNDSKLHLKLYQREDDELWGTAAMEPPLRGHLDGSSGSEPVKPVRARTKEASSYQSYRNPQVSDMLPAIVTKVNSKEDVAWMLQPPPVADVMSGKQRPPRSRSGSGNSGPSASGSASLSRQVSNRLVEKKLRAGEAPALQLSRPSSRRAESGVPGQGHDRHSAKSTAGNPDFADSPSKRAKRRPSPIQVPHEPSEESALAVPRNASLAPTPRREMQYNKVASRPQLSTILSDSIVPYDSGTDFYTPGETAKENSFPSIKSHSNSSEGYNKTARRSAVLVKDDSLKVLQDTTPNTPMFNTKIFTTSPAVVDTAKIRLPAQDGDEEQALSGAFDSWYMPDFQLDQWVHEHTKREVRQRWSMDL